MEKNDDKSENVCINLDFSTSPSPSKQEKIKEFWKFLDSQDVLKPFKQPTGITLVLTQPFLVVDEEKPPESRSSPPPPENNASSSRATSTKPKENSKRNKVQSKNRNDDQCKLEKYFREDLRYADTLEPSYAELNAEIEEYQRRLLQCGCKTKNCDCKKKLIHDNKTRI
ncbi:hypothetical protein TSAR_007741 [Trichomalopsis sarcophagae]|uniref:Uncharacterized protein n=1 Tax=Trichomalopsis sarcophagae TaxID=543379 RepID=A0A232F3B1_9HYME|nr:hypothetical protein TSAR_007741 [Trichomalopsis sarcophagae]